MDAYERFIDVLWTSRAGRGRGTLPLFCSQQIAFVSTVFVRARLPTLQPTIALMARFRTAP